MLIYQKKNEDNGIKREDEVFSLVTRQRRKDIGYDLREKKFHLAEMKYLKVIQRTYQQLLK